MGEIECSGTLRRLTVGEIKAAPVLFYDRDFDQECLEFCRLRDIDSLPDTDGTTTLWMRTPEGFESQEMPPDRLVSEQQYPFEGEFMELLGRHEVMFVWSHAGLVGAIHFSDYNHPAVASHLYDVIACYERSLRLLATRMGLGANDLVALLTDDDSQRVKSYQRLCRQNPGLPEWNVAYLDDLQKLVNSKTDLRLDVESMRHVRNSTMHSKGVCESIRS